MTDTTQRAKLSEVAALLGGGWALDAGQRYPYLLKHADGRTVVIRVHEITGRYEIDAYTPQHYFTDEEKLAGLKTTHEITVTGDAAPAALARAITVRLLPKYEASLAVVRAAQVRADEAQRLRAEEVGRLVAAGVKAGAESRADREGRIESALIPSNDGATQVHGTFKPSYGGQTVAVELHEVPVELAEQIMALIAGQAGE